MRDLIQRAVLELGINVPIYSAEIQERDGKPVAILYLYGGKRVEYTIEAVEFTAEDPARAVGAQHAAPPAPPVPSAPPAPSAQPADDFTVIPGVGPATAQALRNAGYFTFQDLRSVDPKELLNIDKVTSYTVAKIKEYLYINFT